MPGVTAEVWRAPMGYPKRMCQGEQERCLNRETICPADRDKEENSKPRKVPKQITSLNVGHRTTLFDRNK